MINQINKKKAFTLIELMAVVIILGIITTITVTSINYSLKISKDRLYVQQIKRLEEGVRKWAVENTEALPFDETGIVFFSVSRLKDEGIVDTEKVMDPRTNFELTGCMTIRYEKDYSQYSYEYEDMDCAFVSNSYMPLITVVGGDEQFVEVNGVYVFKMANSVNYNGRPLEVVGPIIYNSSDQIVTSIDKSIVGTEYTLEYKSTDKLLNLTQKKDVKLTVRDTVSPVITCDGRTTSYTVIHESSSSFSFPSCTVSDNSCGIGGLDTTVNSCVNTLTPQTTSNLVATVPGTYTIEYTAKDLSENPRVLIVSVNVTDTTAPTTPVAEYRLNNSSGALYDSSWTKENIWIGNIASVEEGSGIEKYQYATGSSCATENPSWVDFPNGQDYLVVSSNTNTEYCLSAIDYANNRSLKSTLKTIQIDKTVPTTPTLTVSEGWTNSNVSGTIGGSSDLETGILGYEYSMSGATTLGWTSGSSFTVSNAGQTTVSVRSVNSVGLVSSSTSKIVRIDKTAPTCASSGGSTTWTNGNRTITGTCTDTGGSGCSSATVTTTYSSNINTTTASGGSVSDAAGNTATCPGNQTVRIDKTAPTCASSGGSSSWTNGNRTITGTCTDTGGSGCSSATVTTTYSSNINTTTASGGSVSDAAGNTATCSGNQTVRIDKTAPTLSSITNSSGGSWTNSTVTIGWTAADSGGSGFSQMQFSYDKSTINPTSITQPTAGATSWTGSAAWSAARNNTVYLRITDQAGNVGAWTAGTAVKIDKTLPTAGTLTCGQQMITSTSYRYYISYGADASSGVNYITFYAHSATRTIYRTGTLYYTSTSSLKTVTLTSRNVYDYAGNRYQPANQTITCSLIN